MRAKFFFGAGVLALGLTWFFVRPTDHFQRNHPPQVSEQPAPLKSKPSLIPIAQKPEVQKDMDLQQMLKEEAIRVGQIDQDPEQTQRELERWADALSPEQLRSLEMKSVDISVNPDERALSVYLLSLHQSESAIKPLQEVILSPLPSSLQDRALVFEEGLRAQAIEGLLKHQVFHQGSEEVRQTLQNLTRQTDSRFLLDQANRGLAFLDGLAEHPGLQAQKALQTLLNKPRVQQ